MEKLFTTLTHAVEGTAPIALIATFVWGILSILLSPCHLSSIPLIVGFIGQQGKMSTKRALITSTLFAIGILVLLLADAASSLVMYYEINHGDRLEWRKAFDYVHQRRSDDDVIVSSAPKIGSYYSKSKIVHLKDIQPDMILRGNKIFWFVVDSELGWFYSEKAKWVHENTQLIDFKYLRVKEPINLRIYRISHQTQL